MNRSVSRNRGREDERSYSVGEGRKSIKGIAMNLSGRGGNMMGITPAYKINYIREFLESVPDVIFFQDCIQEEDITTVLKEVSHDRYKIHFQETPEKTEKGKESRKGREVEDEEGSAPPPQCTAIAWISDKYFGTPLQLTDQRLGKLADWVTRNNITVVKLDSTQKVGYEDVHPSFIAISWEGMDYDSPLRDRTRICREFIDFIVTLRSNNWSIPILVGADFNMDMRNFDLSEHPEINIVPYRPKSGKNRGMKNTFLFTMDNIQITEANYKMFHPEIFSSPWVQVTVRGRVQIKMWAVVRIQRCFKRFLKRKAQQKESKKKRADTKERWKKHIEGDDYVPSPPSASSLNRSSVRSRGQDMKEINSGQISRAGSVGFVENYYVKQDFGSGAGGNRRQKFAELKSIQERKRDQSQRENWLDATKVGSGRR